MQRLNEAQSEQNLMPRMKHEHHLAEESFQANDNHNQSPHK